MFLSQRMHFLQDMFQMTAIGLVLVISSILRHPVYVDIISTWQCQLALLVTFGFIRTNI